MKWETYISERIKEMKDVQIRAARNGDLESYNQIEEQMKIGYYLLHHSKTLDAPLQYKKRINLQNIKSVVESSLKIKLDEKNNPKAIIGRKIFSILARELTTETYERISKAIGKRYHLSQMQRHIRSGQELLRIDKSFYNKYEKCKQSLLSKDLDFDLDL